MLLDADRLRFTWGMCCAGVTPPPKLFTKIRDNMTDEASNQLSAVPPNQKPRAQRFPIQAPMRFRESGGSGWSEGTTINISSSGVLFWAAKALQAKTAIEMQILFPAEVTGTTAVNITCSGKIVRTLSVPSPDPRSAMAAAILHFRIKQDLDLLSGR